MKKKKKILLISGGILFSAFIIIGSVVLFILSLIFTEKPIDSEMPDFQSEDLQKVMLKLKDVRKLIYTASADMTDTIKLTENEFNALAVIGGSAATAAEGKPLKIRMKNSMLSIQYSEFTDIWTPFGSCINFKIKVIPSINNNKLNIKIISAYAGSWTVPDSVSSKILRKQIEKTKKSEYYRLMMKIIKKLEIKQNKFILVYYPSKLRILLRNPQIRMLMNMTPTGF